STEGLGDFGDQLRWPGIIGQVCLKRATHRAGRFEARYGVARAGSRTVVVDGDLHALGTERQRNGLAHATSSAGHECNASGKVHVFFTAFARSSCQCNHSMGTRMTPSVRGPGTPCQSDPPDGTSAKCSTSAIRRDMSSLLCPGCRTSTPSRPSSF